MAWLFHASDPMGGAAGEAFANTLKSPGMLPEHVLAREAIQNSVDAGNGAKVEVRFRASVVKGAKKTTFVQAADLGRIAERSKELMLSGPNCLATLDKPQKELCLLYVEDYNAVGLSGNPHDKDSNFYRLLLSLGDRSKSRTALGSTGGSYGFGKSVYSSSSAIQTIFAYTRFKDGNTERTRIFGCGYFVSHDFKKNPYSGRAWLGMPEKKDDKGRIVVDPIEGAKADELAAKLGFTLRKAGELGTSILIVDAAVDIKAIERGIEDWWWPRLIENKLDVVIQDSSGADHYPKPKKNPAIKPFIEAYDVAVGRAVAKSGVHKLAPFNKEGGLEMGRCGFVVAPLDPSGNVTVPPERVNSVALIRGPLMVVAYHPVSQANPAIVGAYVAPDEDVVEQLLRKSEPPAHDRWDPDSTNLRDADQKGHGIVQSILNRIKQHLRKFQTEAAPATPVKQRRMTQLERALGTYFKPSGSPGNPPPPDTGPSPLHLEFSKAPYAEAAEGGMLRLKSVFTVRLDDTSEEDSVPLRLQMNCPVLEDNNEEGDNLPLSIVVEGVEAVNDEANPWTYRFTLPKNGKAKFKVESAPYDPAWTVRLRPDIDRMEAQ